MTRVADRGRGETGNDGEPVALPADSRSADGQRIDRANLPDQCRQPDESTAVADAGPDRDPTQDPTSAAPVPELLAANPDRALPGVLHLLQFTDLHLFGDPQGRLLGQCTRSTLDRVLALARARHWPPAALLLTGDLVHDADPAGYRFLRQYLDALRRPWYCIPGNHDQTAALIRDLDPRAVDGLRCYALGVWDLILLDSTIADADGGHLPARVLRGLARHLANTPTRPALVCLHHQPLPIGSAWLDSMQVDNGAALLALADRHTNLRGILWGHVHQAFDRYHRQTRLLATPSTCVQFLPGSDRFALDPATPGYRWLALFPDGRIDTGCERIDAYPDPLQRCAHGY